MKENTEDMIFSSHLRFVLSVSYVINDALTGS